jgi:ribosomal protein L23
MPYLSLAKTEKSYNQTAGNVYTLVFDDISFKPNKTELAKILKKHSLDAVQIRVVNPYSKTKFRKSRANKVTQTRPKKYYVTLAKGQKIADDLKLEA